jgi:L-ascorbate metabolism protein UlaG (beta-lactamase superfamily)
MNARTHLALACTALLGLAWFQESARPARTLELEYLANEGFLLRGGGRAALIDAFVTEPLGEYAAVPAELFARLVEGAEGYARIDLALTTHVHKDHFQAEPAATFLAAHDETRFVAAPEVVTALEKALGEDATRERLLARLPEARARLAERELGLELVRLPHTGGARTAAVQNLGHVLTLGGVRVLHVGDAERESSELDAHDLEGLALDVALVPYWWIDDAAGLARVRALTGAKELVAMHVPSNELAEVKARLAALDPRVLLLEKPAERRTLHFQ